MPFMPPDCFGTADPHSSQAELGKIMGMTEYVMEEREIWPRSLGNIC